jgi:predicted nucleic acid-binding protein
MKVLVDTAVWSLALRRHAPSHAAVDELRHLIADGRAALTGPIRQELLSGIRETAGFVQLREHLRAFPDERLESEDYERAAEHFNTCRSKGLQGSNTDLLLCALAERRHMPILTTDEDFVQYARVLPVALHPFKP